MGSEILRRADISIREIVATTEGHHIREDTHPCELNRGEVLILNLKSQKGTLRAQGEATVSEGKRSIAIALIDVVTILQRHPLREVGYVKCSTLSVRIAAPLSSLSDPLEVPLTISAKEVDPFVRLSVRAILHRLEVIGVYRQRATIQRTADDQRHTPSTLRKVRATCSRDGCTRLLRMEVEAIAWHSRAIGISRTTLHLNRGDRDRLSGIRRAKDDSRSDIARHSGGIKVWSGLRRATIRLIIDDIVKGTTRLPLLFGRRRRRLA